MDTPGISTGYWKARNRPSRARISGSMSSRSLSPEGHRAGIDAVAVATGKHRRERALSGAVGPHDGVHGPRLYVEIDPAQNALAVHAGVEVADPQHDSWPSPARRRPVSRRFLPG